MARATVPIPSGIIELNYRLEDYNLLLASLNMLLRLLPCCPASTRPASFFTMPFKYVFFGQEILEDTICNGINAKVKFTTFETTLHKLPGLYDEIHSWTQFSFSLICPPLKRQGRSEVNPLHHSVRKLKGGKKKEKV